jgi:hypothetical protein
MSFSNKCVLTTNNSNWKQVRILIFMCYLHVCNKFATQLTNWVGIREERWHYIRLGLCH